MDYRFLTTGARRGWPASSTFFTAAASASTQQRVPSNGAMKQARLQELVMSSSRDGTRLTMKKYCSQSFRK